jgi:hypothetical protein
MYTLEHYLSLTVLYNKPLLRGHAALSSLHQVQGGKERRRKEEEREGERGAAQHSADRRRLAGRNDLRLEGGIDTMLG